MITDSLKNKAHYEQFNETIAKVLDVLTTLDENTPEGKIVIEEGNVWIGVTDFAATPERDEVLFEAHRDFIDIHCILSGKEEFGYANVEKLASVTPYDAEADCEMLRGDISVVLLEKGDFLVTLPQDAHIPCMKKISSGTEKRAVAKIRVGA